jgi:hypothetical protein
MTENIKVPTNNLRCLLDPCAQDHKTYLRALRGCLVLVFERHRLLDFVRPCGEIAEHTSKK